MATPDLSDTRRLTGPGDAPSFGAPEKTVMFTYNLCIMCTFEYFNQCKIC